MIEKSTTMVARAARSGTEAQERPVVERLGAPRGVPGKPDPYRRRFHALGSLRFRFFEKIAAAGHVEQFARDDRRLVLVSADVHHLFDQVAWMAGPHLAVCAART